MEKEGSETYINRAHGQVSEAGIREIQLSQSYTLKKTVNIRVWTVDRTLDKNTPLNACEFIYLHYNKMNL